jgi:hypothetical protein
LLLLGKVTKQFCKKSVLLKLLNFLNFDFAFRAFFALRSLHQLLDAQFTEVVHAWSRSFGVCQEYDADCALEFTFYLVLELLVGRVNHDISFRWCLQILDILLVLLLHFLKRELCLFQ